MIKIQMGGQDWMIYGGGLQLAAGKNATIKVIIQKRQLARPITRQDSILSTNEKSSHSETWDNFASAQSGRQLVITNLQLACWPWYFMEEVKETASYVWLQEKLSTFVQQLKRYEVTVSIEKWKGLNGESTSNWIGELWISIEAATTAEAKTRVKANSESVLRSIFKAFFSQIGESCLWVSVEAGTR